MPEVEVYEIRTLLRYTYGINLNVALSLHSRVITFTNLGVHVPHLSGRVMAIYMYIYLKGQHLLPHTDIRTTLVAFVKQGNNYLTSRS